MMNRRSFLGMVGGTVAVTMGQLSLAGPLAEHVQSVTAITRVFGNGQRMVAVAVGYDRNVANADLTATAFAVEGRTVLRVYANAAADLSDAGQDGPFVIVELDPEDAAAPTYVQVQRDITLSLASASLAVPVNGAVTPQVAAVSLGVNIYTLRGLLDGGLLTEISAIEPQSGRLRRYVGQADLDRFRRQYITATQLSQITGREPGAEAVIQADRGVKRLPLPKRCYTIYHRADVL